MLYAISFIPQNNNHTFIIYFGKYYRIIIDNSAFHKTTKTKNLIECAGCHLLYLPTYSPDLNPIEHCWHTIQSWLRPRIFQHEDLQLLVGNAITEVYHLIYEKL